MVSNQTFSQLALDFEEAEERPHFEKPSYRVNIKIFATLDIKNSRAVVKLSAVDQSVFCAFDKSVMYPASGRWGLQGWTVLELKKIKKAMLLDVLITSYCNVAPKRLTVKYLR